jgi:hypothetical protein
MATRRLMRRAAEIVDGDEVIQAAILCIPTRLSGLDRPGGDLHVIISTQRRHLLVKGGPRSSANDVIETVKRSIVLGPPRGIIHHKIEHLFRQTMWVHRAKFADVRRADDALAEMVSNGATFD